MSNSGNQISWSNADFNWSGGPIDYLWSDVYVVEEVSNAIQGGGGLGMIPEIDPFGWIEKKVDSTIAERFKRIVIRVNGLEKIKDPNKEIKVSADDIRNTIKLFSTKVSISFKEKVSVSL